MVFCDHLRVDHSLAVDIALPPLGPKPIDIRPRWIRSRPSPGVRYKFYAGSGGRLHTVNRIVSCALDLLVSHFLESLRSSFKSAQCNLSFMHNTADSRASTSKRRNTSFTFQDGPHEASDGAYEIIKALATDS